MKVTDPTNKGYQPRGKQVLNPSNIYYTAISGIWQTVWLEPVNNDYIENIEINNDFDNKEIKINLILNSKKQLLISLTLEYNGKSIKFINGHSNTNIKLKSIRKLTKKYEEYIKKLINYQKKGTSAAIYTQTTDVESEINGLITYDREEIKVDKGRIKAANEKIINSLK